MANDAKRRKRRKAAPAGRVLATGLSASSFFGIVSALAAPPAPSWQAAPPDNPAPESLPRATPVPAPDGGPTESTLATTIVTRIERRVIVVSDGDQSNTQSSTSIVGQAPAAAQPLPTVAAPTPAAAAPPTAAPPPTIPAAPRTTAPPLPKCSGSKC